MKKLTQRHHKKKNNLRTNGCHSRTLIVKVFGADVAQHLRSYSLKTEAKGHR